MTREKAVERLKDMLDEVQGWLYNFSKGNSQIAHLYELDIQTLNLAIEALRQDERPKGEWVGWHTDKFVGYDEYGLEIYRHCHYYSCRKCGRRTAVKTNFCPNCGADMRGEE